MKSFIFILFIFLLGCKSQKEITYYEGINKNKIEYVKSRSRLILDDIQILNGFSIEEIDYAIKIIDTTCVKMNDFINAYPEEGNFIGLGRTHLSVFSTGQQLSMTLHNYFAGTERYKFNPNLKIYHFENNTWIESLCNYYPFETILYLELLKNDLLMYYYNYQLNESFQKQ